MAAPRQPARRVGVLALQGSSDPHRARLRELALEPVAVRRRDDLDGLTHLILPGGESTTLHHLLELFDLREALRRRVAEGELAVFGTCAGAILLGRDDGERPPRLALLDAAVERNAYGRQVDSFTAEVALHGLGDRPFHCVFIRAPRLKSVGPAVRVLAHHEGEPILVQAPGILAATFHPELTRDLTIHRHFLEMEPAAAPAGAGAPATRSTVHA